MANELTRAQHYEQRAAEFRKLARKAKLAANRYTFEDMARRYERMAANELRATDGSGP